MSSLAYELFGSMEASDAVSISNSAVGQFNAYFKEFKEKAEDTIGRLYAMLKKISDDDAGAVHTKIKYLKVRCLTSPSKLVADVSDHIIDQILFNEKVCKYDTKTLNQPIARKVCEEHLHALEQLLALKESIDKILTEDTDENSAVKRKNVVKNFKQVSKHLIWSSKRLFANIRIHD